MNAKKTIEEFPLATTSASASTLQQKFEYPSQETIQMMNFQQPLDNQLHMNPSQQNYNLSGPQIISSSIPSDSLDGNQIQKPKITKPKSKRKRGVFPCRHCKKTFTLKHK